MRRFSRKMTVASVFLGVMVAGSIAFAAWTASGTGSGYAKAKSAQPLTTVDVSGSTTATLYPGATGSLLLRVDNPNDYDVTISSVTGNGTITSDKGAACNASTGVTFTDQTGLSLVATHNAQTTFTLSGAVAMSNASDNTCQGAVFTVPVSISGASS